MPIRRDTGSTGIYRYEKITLSEGFSSKDEKKQWDKAVGAYNRQFDIEYHLNWMEEGVKGIDAKHGVPTESWSERCDYLFKNGRRYQGNAKQELRVSAVIQIEIAHLRRMLAKPQLNQNEASNFGAKICRLIGKYYREGLKPFESDVIQGKKYKEMLKKGGKGKKGKEGSLKKLLRRIMKDTRNPSLQSILKVLKSDDVNDYIETSKDPLPIATLEVNDGDKLVKYTYLKKEKSRSFTRIDNIRREILRKI